MRAMLVDDERLSLLLLKNILEQEVEEVQVVGMYSDPLQVLESAVQLQPDVVFLDIHMPELNGLKLGEQLQVAVPETEIVFVTAYDQYAVQAFELYAMDYLVKPIVSGRLKQAVQRLSRRQKKDLAANKRMTGHLMVSCFNHLRFLHSDRVNQPVKWRTSKAQELFAFLLHHRERVVERNIIFELLWPEFEAAKAAKQLYTTIYHIRQTLKNNGMGTITIHSGDLETGYRLHIGDASVDSEQWETYIKQLGPLDHQCTGNYELALKMYKGDYLGEYEYIWAEYERERLRRLWLHYATLLSEFYAKENMPQAALQINQRIQHFFPYDEESYFTAMKLYDSIGDRAGVEEQYWLLASRLERELDSNISEAIYAWYLKWKNDAPVWQT
ncbi:response regulator [Paenibacillaceae bacterium]|nr:response regulator [Paenibacillaceae bacterium]